MDDQVLDCFNQIEYELSREQRKRISNMHRDPLYLIEVDGLTYKVVGSKADVYTVVVNIEARTLRQLVKCNCHDHKLRGRMGTMCCKHCCFILFKALGLPELFVSEKVVCSPEFHTYREFMKAQVARLQQTRNWGDLTSQLYQERYTQLKSGAETASYTVQQKEDITEPCMICFETPENIQKSAKCPLCRKIFDKECIERWLEITQTCPHCKYTWATYNQDPNKTIVNLS
jgi:hypothetical protein